MGSTAGAKKRSAKKHGLSLEEYEAKIAVSKWCSTCKDWVSRDFFSLDRSRSDGLSARCRPCDDDHRVKYPVCRDPDKSRDQMREWRTAPENQEKSRKWSQRWYAENRDEAIAKSKAYYEANTAKVLASTKACRVRRYEKYLWKRVQKRAAERGLPFDLEVEDIVVPDVCPVLGIPLTKEGGEDQDAYPSLDRLIPSRGYVKGNVRVISKRANQIKSNATVEEVEKVLAYMKENIPYGSGK